METERNDFDPGEPEVQDTVEDIAKTRETLKETLGEAACQKLALALMNDRCLPEALPAQTIEEAVPQLIGKYPGAPFNLLNIGELKSGIADLKENLLPNKKDICRILYAMKANPQAVILKTMRAAGLDGFDCASSNEVDAALMEGTPVGHIHYNFPKHSPRELNAILRKGVRYVTVDTRQGLEQVLAMANGLPDKEKMEVAVRIAVENPHAAMPMNGKFGIPPDRYGEVKKMIEVIRNSGARPGLCVHVGSQTEDPEVYREAIETIANLARGAGGVNHINLGGGLPVDYYGIMKNSPEDFIRAINEAVDAHVADGALTGDNQKILFEFGRFLVAPSVHWISPIRSMEAGNGKPCLNYAGGIHNTLNGLKIHGWPMPPLDVVAQDGAKRGGAKIPCILSGESCNPADMVEAEIPSDTVQGDYLLAENVGAYTDSYGSTFNGFALPTYALYNT